MNLQKYVVTSFLLVLLVARYFTELYSFNILALHMKIYESKNYVFLPTFQLIKGDNISKIKYSLHELHDLQRIRNA